MKIPLLPVLVMVCALLPCLHAQPLLLEKLNQRWNEDSGQWEDFSRNVRLYDEFGNATNYLTDHWRKTLNAWSPSSEVTYTYNEEGEWLSYFSRYWLSATNNWYYTNRTLREFNEEGQLLKEIRQKWNGQDWYDTYRRFLIYGELGRLQEDSTEIWRTNYPNPAYWSISGRQTYHYDESDQLTEISAYSWNADESVWVEAGLTKYTYDGAGNQTSQAYYGLEDGESYYIGQYKTVYDLEGRIIESITDNLTDIPFDERSIRTYDAGGNLATITYQNGDFDTFAWTLVSQSQFDYNAQGNQVRSVYLRFEEDGETLSFTGDECRFYCNGLLRESIYRTQFEEDGPWENSFRSVYTYSEDNDCSYDPVCEEENFNPVPLPEQPLVVGPNPVVNELWVNSTLLSASEVYVEVVDMMGRAIMQEKRAAGDQQLRLSTANLMPGTYFIRISVGAHSSKAWFVRGR